MTSFDVVIVGTGHGGAQAAIALRQTGFAGSVLMIGDEPELPYERPPLSKDYLAGDKPFARMLIRPESFWDDRAIAFALGQPVTAVDAGSRTVTIGEKEAIGYGHLIWAAGGSARRLRCAGADLANVHTVRTRADADRMIAHLPQIVRVVVVGGGYIGLEAAAVLRKLGKQVVLLEAQDRVLARVAAPPLSNFYAAEHRAQGVETRLGTTVERIEGSDGMVTGLRLVDGELLACDAVVVGIGIVPEVAPLLAAGAQGGNGVLVDAQCRTSLPGIFAIGDCALHRNRFAGDAPIRIESVQNANDQATVAARTIAGEEAAYTAVPWFWSNQYDLKLQTVGLSAGYDAVVVRGDPATRSFSVVYLREGRVIALDCVNRTRDYVQGRELVLAKAMPDPTLLADETVVLKELVG